MRQLEHHLSRTALLMSGHGKITIWLDVFQFVETMKIPNPYVNPYSGARGELKERCGFWH